MILSGILTTPTGFAYPNSSVLLSTSTSNYPFTTNSSGSYSVNVPFGTYSVDVLGGFDEYAHLGSIKVESGGSTDIVVLLDQAISSIDLAFSLAQPDGTTYIGHGSQTLDAYLDSELSKRIPTVTDFGAVGDGVTDDTAAFQALANAGGIGYIPKPSVAYIVTSVTLPNSITWFGEGDASIIKRKANTDTSSSGVSTATMFRPTAHGKTYTFRDLKFDGNEANQIAYQPYGFLIRFTNVVGSAGSKLAVVVDNCTFVNATQCAINADGNTSTDGIEELVVTNCRFIDGRHGLAAGNPNVTSASGYGPDYITLTDKVYATIRGNSFMYNKTLNTGEFSRTAVRITFDVNTSNADGSRALIEGNYFYRCGRGERDGPERPGNDVGVIDAYARGRELRIANNLFEDSLGSPIRGKTNCDLVYISGNITDSSAKNPGINIGPNSYAQQSGRIVVVNNLVRQAAGLGIAVVGNAGVVGGDDDVNNGENTQDYVSDILISGNIIEGVSTWDMQTNPALGDGIYSRNFRNLVVSDNIVKETDGYGIRLRGQAGTEVPNSQYLTVSNNRVESAGLYGYLLGDGFVGPAIFMGNSTTNSGSFGFSLNATSGGGASLTFTGNAVDNAVDYGFHFRYWNILTADGNHANGITGNSRGFYPQDIASLSKFSSNSTNATTPLFGAGTSLIQDFGNTWNPRVQYRTSVPTVGTWAVGDIVYNSTPTAGGTVGWVCTAAGTPGTWKTFGTIAA